MQWNICLFCVMEEIIQPLPNIILFSADYEELKADLVAEIWTGDHLIMKPEYQLQCYDIWLRNNLFVSSAGTSVREPLKNENM
jgi:hypothetical protein